jgi:hypothetical protein
MANDAEESRGTARRHRPTELLTSLQAAWEVDELTELGRLVTVSGERLSIATEALEHWAREAKLPPPLRSGELRPVFATTTPATNAQYAEYFDGGLLVPVIQRVLSAAHSVALVISSERRQVARLSVTLGALHPLIEAGLVHLVPESALRHVGDFDQWALSETPIWGGSMDARLINFVADLATSYDAVATAPGSFTLAAYDKGSHRLLSGFLRRAAVGTALGSGYDRLNFVPELMNLNLPTATASIADMRRVREDGLFDDWLDVLSGAMSELRTLPGDDLVDLHAAQVRVIERHLKAAAESVAARSQKRAAARLNMQATKFSLAVASGAVGAVGGVVGGAAGAAAGFLGGSILDWVGGRPSQSERAFTRFMTNFLPSDGPNS